jgi:hypothetical protein
MTTRCAIVKSAAAHVAVAIVFIIAAMESPPATAQSRRAFDPASKLALGRATEMIAPAAVVLSTVHYQAELPLSCGANVCAGDFPRPGVNRRLNATRVTCLFQGSSDSTYNRGWIELRALADSHLLYQFLPVDYQSTGAHVINRAIDVQVGAKQHLRIDLRMGIGDASSGTCSVTGALDTLG